MSPRRDGGSRAPRAVLGLSALGHDPAACLVVDGALVAAVEEERLNREKRTWAFPHLAIESVLRQAGLTFQDLDRIGYYWDDRGQLFQGVYRVAKELAPQPFIAVRLAWRRAMSARGPSVLRSQLRMHAGASGRLPPVDFVPHHRAHLMAAWSSAPFTAHGGLIVDGRGEYAASSLFRLAGEPRDGRFELLEEISFPNSLGVFYGAVTQALGYTALGDEYRVMGLASYGEPEPLWQGRVARLLDVHDDGTYQLDTRSFAVEHCSRPYQPWLRQPALCALGAPLSVDRAGFDDACRLAYAAQERLELALFGLVKRLVAKSRGTSIVMGGGVAMNSRAVGRVLDEGLVDALHLPLAPTDSGAAVGAALDVLRRRGGPWPTTDQLVNPFLGPSYSEHEIERRLQAGSWSYLRAADVACAAADDIVAGRIVGWFDGAMEFGERALGARSILADARDPNIPARLNASVKRRETYRPFAPAVLEEVAAEYFDVIESRRMGLVVRATEKARRLVPAVVHIDGTARPQTIPRCSAARSFRRLVEHVAALTGVPMVVNTSFNVMGEPIVCTPDDALRCFRESRLDRLFIGPFVVDPRPGRTVRRRALALT